MSLQSGDLKDRIEKRVNEGLLGQWYPVAKSNEVTHNRPFSVTALGRRLVLWRDVAGDAKCVEDYCPHRGARLSRGEIVRDNIACRYHGVVVSGEGGIVTVPAMPNCPLEGRKAVASYSITEKYDAIFAYFPSVPGEAVPPLSAPREFDDPEWTGFLCTSNWACNYRYAIDNLADPMHGCFLHADSFTLAYGEKQDLMKLDKTDEGFIVSKVHQAGQNFDYTEMVVGSAIYCRLDIPYPKAAGPGSFMRILGYTLPVDPHNCRVFFWRMRKVGGLQRDSWRFLYRAKLEPRHWKVLEQDREALVNMPDDARKREMLYQHDIGVSRMRQILTRMAKGQVEADEQGALRTAG